MRLSELMYKGFEGRLRAFGHLAEFDENGIPVACCVIGAIALGLDIPLNDRRTGGYTNEIAGEIDAKLDCTVLHRLMPRPQWVGVPDDEIPDFGRIHIAQEVARMSDRGEALPAIADYLDALEAKFCGDPS